MILLWVNAGLLGGGQLMALGNSSPWGVLYKYPRGLAERSTACI